MKVADLMTVETVTVRPEQPLKDAARVLGARGVSGLPVVDGDGVVVGVLSEADILAKEVDGRRASSALLRFLEGPPLDDRFEAVTVGEAMSAPAIVIGPERRIPEAAGVMLEEGINRLPVVDGDGRLVGIVTRADLVRAFARDDETVRDEILAAARDDLWLDPRRITVEVSQGVVSLGGELDSASEERALVSSARRVPGAVEVVSRITTR
jgi:CBS domain-containing protein